MSGTDWPEVLSVQLARTLVAVVSGGTQVWQACEVARGMTLLGFLGPEDTVLLREPYEVEISVPSATDDGAWFLAPSGLGGATHEVPAGQLCLVDVAHVARKIAEQESK